MTDQNDGEPDYDDEDGFEPGDDYDYLDEDDFADPGGTSALRAATKDNPRDRPCPTCGWPNRLTPKDVALGYQCNSCANALERGTDIDYYEGEEDEDGVSGSEGPDTED